MMINGKVCLATKIFMQKFLTEQLTIRQIWTRTKNILHKINKQIAHLVKLRPLNVHFCSAISFQSQHDPHSCKRDEANSQRFGDNLFWHSQTLPPRFFPNPLLYPSPFLSKLKHIHISFLAIMRPAHVHDSFPFTLTPKFGQICENARHTYFYFSYMKGESIVWWFIDWFRISLLNILNFILDL